MRSSPMPVSMDGRGSGVMAPLASRFHCMKTRFQISSQRSHSHAGPRHGRPAAASAHGRWSPWWKWISEHGPHGPVSPMAQKLSSSPRRKIRSSARPATFLQSPNASSSSVKTVALSLRPSRPRSRVRSSQANATASALK